MEIASIEVLHVGSELSGTQTVVRLATDSGIVGLGQSGGWGYQTAVADIVEDLKPVLLGADPFRIEHLWNAMVRARPFRGNLIGAAVSAVDNALWDIKGKALQVPVWELLGGRSRDKVRAHALIGGSGPDELARSVRWAVGEGYTAVKFDPLVAGYQDLTMPKLVDSACEMAAASREAGGDDLDIIFELHRKLDPAKGFVVANALANFRPLFIEDPVQIDSITSQAEVCAAHKRPYGDRRAFELYMGVPRTAFSWRCDPRSPRCRPLWRPVAMPEDRDSGRGVLLRCHTAQFSRSRAERPHPTTLRGDPEPHHNGVRSP